MFSSSKAESSEIAAETFSTSSGNCYTVLRVEEAEKTDILETYFTKYEEKESLPEYLKHVLIKETVFVELKKRLVEPVCVLPLPLATREFSAVWKKH